MQLLCTKAHWLFEYGWADTIRGSLHVRNRSSSDLFQFPFKLCTGVDFREIWCPPNDPESPNCADLPRYGTDCENLGHETVVHFAPGAKLLDEFVRAPYQQSFTPPDWEFQAGWVTVPLPWEWLPPYFPAAKLTIPYVRRNGTTSVETRTWSALKSLFR